MRSARRAMSLFSWRELIAKRWRKEWGCMHSHFSFFVLEYHDSRVKRSEVRRKLTCRRIFKDYGIMPIYRSSRPLCSNKKQQKEPCPAIIPDKTLFSLTQSRFLFQLSRYQFHTLVFHALCRNKHPQVHRIDLLGSRFHSLHRFFTEGILCANGSFATAVDLIVNPIRAQHMGF